MVTTALCERTCKPPPPPPPGGPLLKTHTHTHTHTRKPRQNTALADSLTYTHRLTKALSHLLSCLTQRLICDVRVVDSGSVMGIISSGGQWQCDGHNIDKSTARKLSG